MADKLFYWIKLKTDFFNEDEIDFLLSQKNGCEYVVLYQMLCLKTANTDGKLQKSLGEIIVPYDINKIVRDCKYFDYDTVTVALELYKQLGLIYIDENNVLTIAKHEDMIGSETSGAKRIREWREKQKLLHCNTDVTQDVTSDVTQEIRDKSIDNREKENRDKRKNIEVDKRPARTPKHKYGEYGHVLLKDDELEKLNAKYGEEETKEAIKYLDEYIEMKGTKYRSHYLALKKWVYRAVKDHRPREESIEEMMKRYGIE